MRTFLLALLLLTLPALSVPLPVHMLVPGFTVRELPIQITNLNNLAYGPDNRLYAVGYDGRVHVLVDSDNDGLEDTVLPWCYDHAADMRTPVGMIIRPEGMYIASKGRVSLLKDTTGSGKADHYDQIVGGWTEIKNNVDALGVAIDSAGNLYYGRGAQDYRNPLLTDKDGVPHYDLKAESGTVIKVSADRKTREIIATGIRFTVALAINRDGDLFATDQEGATWVPNGNPLDKIEQIIPGRHYGFPPKSLNPAYLKDIVDEPPVVAFGPQHQSSCGMKFNERTDKQPSFGPDFWEGDAIVAGESRGKLWRCPLVKTSAGYVGKPILIACLDMLTLDVVVSPKGDLLVCCHSGKPDWGTGPKGQGRVFKISYTDKEAPQPVTTWASGTDEISVNFDRPIQPYRLPMPQEMLPTVICGRYVRAGDRMEILKPPYAAVKQQEAAARRVLHVKDSTVSVDGKTLVIHSDPFPWRDATYAAAIPGVRAMGSAGPGVTVDVDFGLHGISGEWFQKGSRYGTLLHLSTDIHERLTRGAGSPPGLGAPAPMALQFPLPSDYGSVFLRAVLDLPGNERTLTLRSKRPFHAMLGNNQADAIKQAELYVANVSTADPGLSSLIVNVDFTRPFWFDASYHTDEDPHERPIPIERIYMEGAGKLPPAPDAPIDHKPRGDWARGKSLFSSAEAKCSACHTVRGEGGSLGPDLSNLTFKDPDAVLVDILTPSAAINPDYISYNVKLKNGTLLTGIVTADGDQFKITEAVDKTTAVNRADVQSMTPSPISIMPEGFKSLGDDKLNDLLEFLTGEQPKK